MIDGLAAGPFRLYTAATDPALTDAGAFRLISECVLLL
jgi:hypothetical protein